ncbi:Ran-binding protein 10 [Zancudomyces culisetae]|uniref:Ran-binding protein 10 n=1 Tax=Zancudomyces culisetae TaxID=1213189 RepID=A0A1R1PU21_ZANCU|nr:Ran-binding protein 10 [Zancudomyces culisetae]|eukprot:OMH84392.1 Ran-binding protein 10 [Zancudomyces culisetae]
MDGQNTRNNNNNDDNNNNNDNNNERDVRAEQEVVQGPATLRQRSTRSGMDISGEGGRDVGNVGHEETYVSLIEFGDLMERLEGQRAGMGMGGLSTLSGIGGRQASISESQRETGEEGDISQTLGVARGGSNMVRGRGLEMGVARAGSSGAEASGDINSGNSEREQARGRTRQQGVGQEAEEGIELEAGTRAGTRTGTRIRVGNLGDWTFTRGGVRFGGTGAAELMLNRGLNLGLALGGSGSGGGTGSIRGRGITGSGGGRDTVVDIGLGGFTSDHLDIAGGEEEEEEEEEEDESDDESDEQDDSEEESEESLELNSSEEEDVGEEVLNSSDEDSMYSDEDEEDEELEEEVEEEEEEQIGEGDMDVDVDVDVNVDSQILHDIGESEGGGKTRGGKMKAKQVKSFELPEYLKETAFGQKWHSLDRQETQIRDGEKKIVHQMKFPNRWNRKDSHSTVKVISGKRGLQVDYVGKGKDDADAGMVRTNYAIPKEAGIFYFEVRVISQGQEGYIGVGFCGRDVPLGRLPGWDPNSWGYHGDDGNSFLCNGHGKSYGPTYGTDDVIGCGINFMTKEGFFTKNGVYLGTAFSKLDFKGAIYGCIGMRTVGEKIDANFGQKKFQFDIESYVSKQRQELWSEVKATNIKPYLANVEDSSKKVDEKQIIEELVLAYLVHHGYGATADAFVENSVTLRQNQTHNEHGDSRAAKMLREPYVEQRKRICQLIKAGQVFLALDQIRSFYPNLICMNPELIFKMRCQGFVELVKVVYNEGEGGEGNGTTLVDLMADVNFVSSSNDVMDVDDEPPLTASYPYYCGNGNSAATNNSGAACVENSSSPKKKSSISNNSIGTNGVGVGVASATSHEFNYVIVTDDFPKYHVGDLHQLTNKQAAQHIFSYGKILHEYYYNYHHNNRYSTATGSTSNTLDLVGDGQFSNKNIIETLNETFSLLAYKNPHLQRETKRMFNDRGSVGSIESVGSVGSVGSAGSAGSVGSVDGRLKDKALRPRAKPKSRAAIRLNKLRAKDRRASSCRYVGEPGRGSECGDFGN